MNRRSLNVLMLFAVVLALMTGFVQPLTTTKAYGIGPDLKKALQWMLKFQNKDGGFTDGFKPESSLGATADALIAIATMHVGMADFKNGDASPMAYLAGQVSAGKANTLGALAKVTLAVVALDAEPQKFGGRDLVKDTGDAIMKVTDASDLFSLSLGILALIDAGAPVPGPALDILVKAQNDDGGWGYAAKQPSDTNTTALAVQALVAGGRKDEIKSALAYFKGTQNEDGGWPFQKPSQNGTDSDSNSTASVIQALIAANEDLSTWGKENPLVFLTTFQMPSGAFTYQLKQPAESFLSTVAVIPAFNQVTLAALNPNVVATPVPTQAK